MLLEKAWAKINGNYNKIIGGFSSEVLHDLTGAPCVPVSTHSPNLPPDELWKYLAESNT